MSRTFTAPAVLLLLQLAAHGNAAVIGGKFAPSGNGRYLVLGQDTASIDEYVKEMGQVPAGVSGYTSLAQEGLMSEAEYGTGPQNMKHLADSYPNVHLLIGLFVRDDLSAIANGQKDAEIRSLLNTLESLDREIFLRFGYEVEGPWNRMEPSVFVPAWQRFYGVLEKHSVRSRIAMVWHLGTNCVGTYNNHPIGAWWPGKDYVDWVGVTMFSAAGSPDQLGGPGCWHVVDEALNFAREEKMPVAVCEAAAQGYHLTDLTVRGITDQSGSTTRSITARQIWNNWFKSFFDYIERNGDVIRSVTYISANWEGQRFWNHEMGYHSGYWGDTRVHVNNFIRGEWNKVVKAPTYVFSGSVPTPPPTPEPPSTPKPPTTPEPPTPPPPTGPATGCPPGYNYRGCGQCWTDVGQARSGQCFE